MTTPSPSSPSSSALSRRAFLRSAAVSASLLGLSQSLGAASAGKAKTKSVVVGAHPWVYAATQPNRELTPVLPQIFADMQYAGMEGIELMHTALRPANAVEQIGELSQKHQLPVIGTSFNGAMWNRDQHQAVLDDAELIIPRLAKLGGRTLGTSVGPLPAPQKARKKTEAELDAQAEFLRKLMALAARHGVVVNLHNHTYEVENGVHDLSGTLARVSDVKLGPDLNWLVRGGVDPAAFIRKHGKRIVFMHLRDQKKDGRWPEALGEGDTDFAEIARALKEVGFEGDAVIELAHERDFTPTRPLRESLKMSRQFVRNVLGY